MPLIGPKIDFLSTAWLAKEILLPVYKEKNILLSTTSIILLAISCPDPLLLLASCLRDYSPIAHTYLSSYSKDV
jgi:hypothetical protein